jgi:methionine synthase / methylenetetrahydrofolate reductase(NADPH)
MANAFKQRLDSGLLLADGAMGTMIYSRGVPFERCFDELNLSAPDLIQQIHREYIVAGAEIIETNTFGANRVRLAAHGLAERVRDINYRGAKIAGEARDIVGEPVFVAGCVGPVGQPLQPIGKLSLLDVRLAFREQIEALLEGGVDLLVFDTFADLAELTEGVLAARETCELSIIAQLTFENDGRTYAGHSAEDVVAGLRRLGVDIIGVNCSNGPQIALDVVRRMVQAGAGAVSVMPNAGLPAQLGGRLFYVSTPDYFGDYARQFRDAGASVVGGCCGTTPEHIRAMRLALKDDAGARVTVVATRETTPAPEPTGQAEGPSTLARKLAAGEFVVSVEVDPPRGLNPTKALKGTAILKEAGADCINIGDSPMAKVRMSALGLGMLIQQQVGLEVILHYTTRDRNLMALQSELMGAHALGIRNVIGLTGDPPKLGNYPNATPVWDVDSIGLIAILKRLNQGIDHAGTSIGRRASFTVACAVNPTADDIDHELDRLRQKIEAGADFIMSQPLFSMGQLDDFMGRVGSLPLPHVLGILPLESHKHAELLHHEVPGITVPDEVRERMRLAGENGKAEGMRIAHEFVEEARRHVAGVYIITSYGRYEVATELVRTLRAATSGARR